MREVVDCDLAIEALNKELEMVEAKRNQLVEEVAGLCAA